MWSILKKNCETARSDIPVTSDELCEHFQNKENKFLCTYFNESFEEEAVKFMDKYDKKEIY